MFKYFLGFLLIILSSTIFSQANKPGETCLLYTSDAADERSSVDLGGRRIIKKRKKQKKREKKKKQQNIRK